jgi:hypothetical protein
MNPAELKRLNITPDPKILPMLGEITLLPAQCIAELCDNSIDSFIRSYELGKDSISKYRIDIFVPRDDSIQGEITIKDNGTGMIEDELVSAVKAGWSGNEDYFGLNLGLFGMGFNIATARLGRCTTIKTSIKGSDEWLVMRIDFDSMLETKTFETTLTKIPKDDSELSGTEVTISKLKDDQIKWFSKTSNQLKLRKSLGNFYSAMIRKDNPYPIAINIKVNNKNAVITKDVMWGSVDDPINFIDVCDMAGHTLGTTTKGWGTLADGSEVTVPYNFEYELEERFFCQFHWRWLGEFEGEECSSCENSDHTNSKKPMIRGWLGIQKFDHLMDFGINLIRKGRVIEYKSKDLFYWTDNDGKENIGHPWDSQRGRGRIIGEIYLDDVAVNYTKDRFARESWIWQKLLEKLTHNEPLSNRTNLGFPKERTSPMSRYVQLFDRMTPATSKVNSQLEWLRVLGMSHKKPKEFAKKAESFADLYRKGDESYGQDSLYLELIKDSWKQKLGNLSDDDPNDPDFEIEPDQESDSDKETWENFTEKDNSIPPQVSFDTISKNIKTYKLIRLGYESPLEVGEKILPWTLILDGESALFVYLSKNLAKANNIKYLKPNFTPIDALLSDLSQIFYDSVKDSKDGPTYSQILTVLRDKYAEEIMPHDLRLETDEIKELCSNAINEIKKRLKDQNSDFHQNLFDMLNQRDQIALTRKISSRTTPDIKRLIKDGKCYDYMDGDMIVTLLEESPESFFDGICWEETYTGISTKSLSEDIELFENYRMRLKMRYLGYLVEAVAVDEGDIEVSDENDAIALQNVRYYTAAINLTDNLASIEED